MPEGLPNFLIVGAAKSGTTSLWKYLDAHPEVFMSRKKEPLFFLSSYVKGLNTDYADCRYLIDSSIHNLHDYRSLFSLARDEKALGEASVGYLSSSELAIPQIVALLGDVRIVIILRNPIDRAYSAFTHQRLLGSETLEFEVALQKEAERIKKRTNPAFYYLRNGLYSSSVNDYLRNFSRVNVSLFDDLEDNAPKLVNELYRFLEVDDTFHPSIKESYNVSGLPKNRWVQRLLNKPYLSQALIPFIRPVYRALVPAQVRYEGIPKMLRAAKRLNMQRSPMRPETRQYLRDFYRDDMLSLQDLLGRDLSRWLT